jgi:phospholipase/carboxylesterase
VLDRYKIRFVFPHAPTLPITINGGMEMRAWYNIQALNLMHNEDLEGIVASDKMIAALIEREESFGVRSDRIILAGFSQGGAMSLYTGLRYPKKLGGMIALSTYLPILDSLEKERTLINQDIPIYMAHGMFDPIVPFAMGQNSKEYLQNLGYKIEWHSYSMPHTVISDEIKDIGHFLNTLFLRIAPEGV